MGGPGITWPGIWLLPAFISSWVSPFISATDAAADDRSDDDNNATAILCWHQTPASSAFEYGMNIVDPRILASDLDCWGV